MREGSNSTGGADIRYSKYVRKFAALIVFVIASWFAGPVAFCQQGNQVIPPGTASGAGAPSGTCAMGALYTNTSNGNFYTCNNGTWLLQSSSGSGTVSGQASGVIPLGTTATSITQQSHLSDNGTTVSSSEPVTAPSVNNVYGIATYPTSCTVAAVNYTTQLDCAWYSLINAGTSVALHLGSNSFSSPYTTCAGLANPATGTLITIIGENVADNNVPGTTIKAICAIQAVISHPDVATGTSTPYSIGVQNININANSMAQQCLALYALKVGYTEHVHCENALSSSKAWVEFGDVAAPGGFTNGGYQYAVRDIFVEGNGNGYSSWATVTPTQSGGTPSIAVNTAGSYVNAHPPAYLYGTGSGAASNQPCTVMGTLTAVMSGSGPYTLSSITVSGFSGCAGTLYAYVPDLPPAPYAIAFAGFTDSTFTDIVESGVGQIAGIYEVNGSNTFIHEHPQSGSPIMILDNSVNVHVGAEIDGATEYGASTGSSHGAWIATQFVWPQIGVPLAGTVGFYQSSATTAAEIDGVSCPNAVTGNLFSLVATSSGPVAHGLSAVYPGNVIAGQQCDTLAHVTALTDQAIFTQANSGVYTSQVDSASGNYHNGNGDSAINWYGASGDRAQFGFDSTHGQTFLYGANGVCDESNNGGGSQPCVFSTNTAGLISIYGSVATAGQGVPTIQGSPAAITLGSATSIGTTSLCSTTACPAGTYTINAYIAVTTACSTGGTYFVSVIFTDDQGSKTIVLPLTGTGTTLTLGPTAITDSLALSSTANFAQGDFTLHSTGAAAISYTTTAGACATGGPAIGKIYLTATRLQ